jgi:hypothetical protein
VALLVLAGPRACPTSSQRSLKQTILDALHNANGEGLYGFVRATAHDTPTAAMGAAPRLWTTAVRK